MAIAVFNILDVEPAVFFKEAFEISLLLFFITCLVHSFLSHGWQRTIREFTAGFFLTACCESIGVLSGAYVYPGFHFYLFSIPIANPASWIALVYVIMEMTNGIVYGSRAQELRRLTSSDLGIKAFALFKRGIVPTILILAAIDSVLALVIDIVMDPLATVFNWWIWVPDTEGANRVIEGTVDPYNFSLLTHLTTPDNPVYQFFSKFFSEGIRYPTRIFGIPLINFISWFVFVFVFTTQFRWVEYHENWNQMKKTVVLWSMMIADVPVLSFLLISPNI